MAPRMEQSEGAEKERERARKVERRSALDPSEKRRGNLPQRRKGAGIYRTGFTGLARRRPNGALALSRKSCPSCVMSSAFWRLSGGFFPHEDQRGVASQRETLGHGAGQRREMGEGGSRRSERAAPPMLNREVRPLRHGQARSWDRPDPSAVLVVHSQAWPVLEHAQGGAGLGVTIQALCPATPASPDSILVLMERFSIYGAALLDFTSNKLVELARIAGDLRDRALSRAATLPKIFPAPGRANQRERHSCNGPAERRLRASWVQRG